MIATVLLFGRGVRFYASIDRNFIIDRSFQTSQLFGNIPDDREVYKIDR